MAHIDSAPAPIAVSVNEAAKALRIHRRKIDAALASGELHAYRIGGNSRRLLTSEIADWVRSQ
jgi:excisionase family DNA binding protein